MVYSPGGPSRLETTNECGDSNLSPIFDLSFPLFYLIMGALVRWVLLSCLIPKGRKSKSFHITSPIKQ